MPLQKRMEMIRPDIFHTVRVPKCREKLQKNDAFVKQWRPAMPIFPRNNIKSTLYNLKKPFYPMFMYDKPDMKKIMTEEYRRMWHFESMKFLCGLDIRESARLPRRPFIKYGLMRSCRCRNNPCGGRRKPPSNVKIPYLCCADRKKKTYHENCAQSDRCKPFRARPVPSSIATKKSKAASQQTSLNDCTVVTFDRDCYGNQVCNVEYDDNKVVTDYYYQNDNFNNKPDQCSEGYGPEVYKTVVFNSDGTQNHIDDGQNFHANDELCKSMKQYDNCCIPLNSSEGNLDFNKSGYYSIIN